MQDHLGLPDYSPDSALQAEINRLVNEKPDISKSSAGLQEDAAAAYEQNCQRVAQYRWKDQDELAKTRLGKILSEREFLRLINKLGAFEYNDWTARGYRGLNIWRNGVRTYTGAVQAWYMPEYSTLRLDNHGLPTREKYRGWRSVLISLIGQDFITEKQAIAVFGPALGPHSYLFNRELQELRNRRMGISL